jgi:hypothetical protein
MKGTARLTSGMLTIGRRAPTTKAMALAPGQKPVSVNADRIAAMLLQAREDLGYDRPGFVRVDRPEDMAPGALMGRYRERVPSMEPSTR